MCDKGLTDSIREREREKKLDKKYDHYSNNH